MSLTAAEQLLIEMINRARLDPEGEAARFGIDLNEGLSPGTLDGSARQVLAPNELLHDASDSHGEWMLRTDTFSHTGAGGSSPGARMADAGYTFSGRYASGENLTYSGSTGSIDLVALMENNHHRDLFLSSGHRVNMLHGFYREIGVSQEEGVFTSGGRDFNASMVVENFALSGSSVFLTGVSYADRDGDAFYSVGEGQGGVSVAAAGQTVQTQAAGGYAIKLSAGADVAVTLGGIALSVDLSQGNGKLDLEDGTHVSTSVHATLDGAAGSLTALGVGDINLTGHAGADVLVGNRGDNVLDGAGGVDTARFDIDRAGATITQDAGGDVRIVSSLGTDTLRDIETVAFRDQTVNLETLFGAPPAPDPAPADPPVEETDPAPTLDYAGEMLVGGAGNDVLYAGGFDVGLAPDVAAQVFRLYQAALDRAPDAAGHAGWTQALFEGVRSLEDVALGFVASAEFQRAYGDLDTGGFVDLLYQNVLGRAADAAGHAGWFDRIAQDGISRAQAVVGFSESAEFVTATQGAAAQFTLAHTAAEWSDDIFRLYAATLDRAPDMAGFDGWTESLSAGQAFTDVVAGFVASDEFRATYGDLDDAGFVELLYQNVLGRASDTDGRQGWLDRLESGTSRAEVVEAFVQSSEFITGTRAALEDWVRAQGVQDVLVAGGGDDVLAGGTLSDAFVFNAKHAGEVTVLDLEVWDTLHLEGFGYADADDARAHLSQQGDSVVFSDQGVVITFEGTSIDLITDDMIVI